MLFYDYTKHWYWQDALQDSYLIMLEKKIKFSDSAEEEKWLKTAAINIIQNMRRKNSHAVCYSDLCSTEEDTVGNIPEKFGQYNNPVIEELLTFDYFYDKIITSDKVLLVLLCAGLDCIEIAGVLKTEAPVIRKRIERARGRMKVIFTDYKNKKSV